MYLKLFEPSLVATIHHLIILLNMEKIAAGYKRNKIKITDNVIDNVIGWIFNTAYAQ